MDTFTGFHDYLRQIGRTYHEQCGLLFWDRWTKQMHVYMVGNAHPTPRFHFKMEGRNVRLLIKALDPEIPIGIFHTHVERDNWEPSEHDIAVLRQMRTIPGKERWFGIVYHCRTKRVTWYGPRGVWFSKDL